MSKDLLSKKDKLETKEKWRFTEGVAIAILVLLLGAVACYGSFWPAQERNALVTVSLCLTTLAYSVFLLLHDVCW